MPKMANQINHRLMNGALFDADPQILLYRLSHFAFLRSH